MGRGAQLGGTNVYGCECTILGQGDTARRRLVAGGRFNTENAEEHRDHTENISDTKTQEYVAGAAITEKDQIESRRVDANAGARCDAVAACRKAGLETQTRFAFANRVCEDSVMRASCTALTADLCGR
jgi:hypothetical protein